MAKSRSRGKKYNPVQKSKDMLATKAQKLLVCQCSAEDFTRLYTTEGKRVKVGVAGMTQTMYEFLTTNLPRMPMKWSTLMMVHCRDQFGKEYMQAQELVANEKYQYLTLAKTFGKNHVRLKNEANQAHIIGFGWISSPGGVTVSEEIASKIMVDLGAWEGKAQWEQDKDLVEQNMYGNTQKA